MNTQKDIIESIEYEIELITKSLFSDSALDLIKGDIEVSTDTILYLCDCLKKTIDKKLDIYSDYQHENYDEKARD
jgi:hypothetical protein